MAARAGKSTERSAGSATGPELFFSKGELRMSTSRKSLADRELRGSKVYEQDQDLAAEMPELRGSLDELRATAQEVAELTAQQRYHAAQAQVLTARVRALAKRADTLRGRAGASLRGKHGFDSPELIRYGFKPRKQVKQDHADRELEGERKAQAAEETEE
jgi:hypothetical protein